jgi:hypothetical protein
MKEVSTMSNQVIHFNNWTIQNFDDHLKISNDGLTITRINHNGKGFEFTGRNPLKLPKTIQQQYINKWMERKCLSSNIAIWDCEAWEGYENTNVVH